MACLMVSYLAFLKCLFLLSTSIFFLSSDCSLTELSKSCLNAALWVSFPTYLLLCRSLGLLGEGLSTQLFGLHPWRHWCRSRAGHKNFDLAKFLSRDQMAEVLSRQKSLWPSPTLHATHFLRPLTPGTLSELATPWLSLQSLA